MTGGHLVGYERASIPPTASVRDAVAPTPAVEGSLAGTAEVVSVNVGQARTVPYRGRAVSTGIYKEPVSGRIRVETLGIVGDRQVDLHFHGGPAKAVYAYPSEHYDAWRRELRRQDLAWGMFGENLTVARILEEDVRVGDRLHIGSTILEVTQPRFPCFKLGIKFGSVRFVRTFLESGRSGFYLAVVREGELGAGDRIRLARPPGAGPTIAAMVDEVRRGEA